MNVMKYPRTVHHLSQPASCRLHASTARDRLHPSRDANRTPSFLLLRGGRVPARSICSRIRKQQESRIQVHSAQVSFAFSFSNFPPEQSPFEHGFLSVKSCHVTFEEAEKLLICIVLGSRRTVLGIERKLHTSRRMREPVYSLSARSAFGGHDPCSWTTVTNRPMT